MGNVRCASLNENEFFCKMTRSALIIGGGIAGASISRALSRSGVRVTLLERSNQLCAGATWHAAGLVTRFAGSPKLKKIHVQSLELMTELHRIHDIGLHLTGSIRIVEKGNTDRLREAKQHLAMAALYDDPTLPTQLLSASDVSRMHPLVDVTQVECGLYTPSDGDVDPTLLTNCIAKEAKEFGASILLNRVVDTISHHTDEFTVTTRDGETYSADMVVNAAGLWSQRFSQQLGMPHPAVVIEHQYAITDTIESVARQPHGVRLPVLRDMRGSSYIRQEGNGLLIGPYEPDVTTKREWTAGPPESWAWDLFPPDMERIEGCLLSAMELVPALGTVGFKSVINGPTIWTGDSLARCGRTHLPGYFDFNSLTYGVAQSLALADYLAHIMLEGEQPYDMAAEVDPLRHGSWATPDYAAEHVTETYRHNNAIVYPFENRESGRRHALSGEGQRALHGAFARRGALFSFSHGVQVPLAYTCRTVGSEEQKRLVNHAWAPVANTEAAHVLSAVGIGYGSFSKLRVCGEDAKELLHATTTNSLPQEGRCRLTYATTRAGNVLAEFSVTKMGAGDYYLVGSRAYAQHDLAWLEKQRRDAGLELVGVEDISDAIEIVHVAGPRSLRMLRDICPEIAQLRFLQMKPLVVCGVATNVFRISFSGELGYELHVPSYAAASLYESICDHPSAKECDLRPFGSHALNALRIEKGYRVKGDLDYAHWTQAGIDPFVSLERKGRTFMGRDSQCEERVRRPVIFSVDTSEESAWSIADNSPIRDSLGAVVGVTTSSARGTETGKTIALGYMFGDDSRDLSIDSYGNRWPAELLSAPPSSIRGIKTELQ